MTTHNDIVEEKEKELIKHMTDRFLGWRLPKDFHPDGGIMFMDVYDNGTAEGGKFEPVGTNLFTAEQAKEMLRFIIENEDGSSVFAKLLTQAHTRGYEEGRGSVVEKKIVNEFIEETPDWHDELLEKDNPCVMCGVIPNKLRDLAHTLSHLKTVTKTEDK